MKNIIKFLAFATALFWSAPSFAQPCSGIIQSGYFCGNPGASSAPSATIGSATALFDRAFGSTANSILARGAGSYSMTQALPPAVQANITQVGTVATGVWHGTILDPTYGGTGINNGSKTITLGGNLSTIGAFNSIFRMSGATDVTFPTSGTLSTTTGSLQKLTGNLILNVPSTYATIQAALNAAAGYYLNGFNITIQVAAGIYPEALTCPAMLTGNRITGGGTVKILGDVTTPSNVEIGGTSFSGAPFSCNNIGYFVLDGVRLTSNTARLVDINASGVTVQLNAVELNNLGANQSGRIGLGANLFILGPVSIISVPSAPGAAIFTSQGAGSIIALNNAAVSPRGALEFPTSLGSGLYIFYANDGGYVQIDTAATFVNAGNWQGKFAHVTIRGIVQVNPALSAMPGGATFDHDGTGVLTTSNLSVASGVYFPNPVGSLGWVGTNGFLNTIDTSANTAARTYTPPNANGILALTAGANIPSLGTGDILYASAPNVLSALPDIATGNALISGGVGVAPSWGKIALGTLATQATNTVLGNATSGAAVPTALSMTSCSTSASAVIWTTNTGFGCNTSINAATLGGATFSAPGAIGGGTPGTGAFTTLTASTSLTSPLHIGGSGTTGTQLTFQTTPNAGTTDGFAWNGGSNGATQFGKWTTCGLSIASTESTSFSCNGKIYAGANDSSAAIVLERASTDTGAPAFDFRKARGTLTSPTIVSSGDAAGDFTFRAWDGSAYRRLAQMLVEVDGTPGASDVPGRMGFFTTLDGTATALRRMTIFNDGGTLIGSGTTSPGAGNFSVSAHILASGTAPTISSCGISPSISGGDNFGTVTAGTGILASCVINFGITWGATPRCVASSGTAIASMTVTATTTQLTIGGTSLTSDVISWVCGSTAFLLERDLAPANDNSPAFLTALAA